MGSQHWGRRGAILLLSLLLSVAGLCSGGVTSSYRRKLYGSNGLPMSDFPPPPGYNAPEQVHITQGDYEGRGVIVSWVNPNERNPSYVTYWKADGEGEKHKIHKHKKHAETKTYKYFNYKSGFIHHATIENLEYDTKYIYELGKGQSVRQFSFVTPPEPGPDVPYTFGLMGDLGQTADSNQTLEHYVNNPKNAQALLFAGDLSYADHYPNHDNRRWDTWGRFVEKSNAYQPWIWAAGNHELDLDQNIGEMQPFKPYLNRYHVPYKAAGSKSPLWYSFRRGPAHIIVLSSYSSVAKYTLQHTWFWNELKNKVNRTITPWVIVVLHTPWYNSNGYHYMEGENLRVVFEPWVVSGKVDLIIAGHVHSYERSYRVSNVKYNITNGLSYPIRDPSAPVYITIGDGGNEEGIANQFIYPQPNYSAFREASFGHAILEIKNRTHAYYTWFRNQDAEPVASDSTWFFNRYYFPNDVDH